MASQLTIVNNVLRRLREDTVSSVADNAYAQLIAMWVNDGMRYTQEAYDWRTLNKNVEFDTVSGQYVYDLTATTATTGDVIAGGSVTNAGSMLRFDDESGLPLAFSYDDSNYGVATQLFLQQDGSRARRTLIDTDQTVQEPGSFSLGLKSDGEGWSLYTLPKPSEVRRWFLVFWVPQDELAIDGTDDATEILVPAAPIEAYVHMTAANERGEELGEPGNLLERRWRDVLGGAIESAMAADNRTNRYESWRD